MEQEAYRHVPYDIDVEQALLGAILMDNAEIGAEALVAAGTLVPSNLVVPPRTLVRGQPGKVIRDLTEEEWKTGRMLAERYVGVARTHAASR